MRLPGIEQEVSEHGHDEPAHCIQNSPIQWEFASPQMGFRLGQQDSAAPDHKGQDEVDADVPDNVIHVREQDGQDDDGPQTT